MVYEHNSLKTELRSVSILTRATFGDTKEYSVRSCCLVSQGSGFYSVSQACNLSNIIDRWPSIYILVRDKVG